MFKVAARPGWLEELGWPAGPVESPMLTGAAPMEHHLMDTFFCLSPVGHVTEGAANVN